MEAALEAGAEDIVTNDDGSLEVITGPYDFVTVKDALAKAGFAPEFAEVTMKPATEVEMAGDDAAKMQKLSMRSSRSTTCRRSTRRPCSTEA